MDMFQKQISKNHKQFSAAPGNFEKPSKNLPAASKERQKTLRGDIFMSFGFQKQSKGPLWLHFSGAKILKNVSGEGFFRGLRCRGRGVGGFFKVFWRHWKNHQKLFFEGFVKNPDGPGSRGHWLRKPNQ